MAFAFAVGEEFLEFEFELVGTIFVAAFGGLVHGGLEFADLGFEAFALAGFASLFALAAFAFAAFAFAVGEEFLEFKLELVSTIFLAAFGRFAHGGLEFADLGFVELPLAGFFALMIVPFAVLSSFFALALALVFRCREGDARSPEHQGDGGDRHSGDDQVA